MKFLTTASSVAVAVVLIMMASSDTVDAADDFTPRRLSSLRLRPSEERELQDFWAREMIADIDSMIISHAPNETPTDSLSTSIVPFTQCFGADDGGRNGVLYNAIRQYVSDGCANNPECDIGKVYGWPMRSWRVGNVMDMSYLFQGMQSFNEDLSGWNTSSVTTMNSMFNDASRFNQDLSSFDTSSVTHMGAMFQAASSFNQDLLSFDTSNVISMYQMFAGTFAGGFETSSFNGNVSHFDTSSCVGMYQMFRNAYRFNQDVSTWNLSSVIVNPNHRGMKEMFFGAIAFNQDLCAWQDNFPYSDTFFPIFTNSGCNNFNTPVESRGGPFCASDC